MQAKLNASLMMANRFRLKVTTGNQPFIFRVGQVDIYHLFEHPNTNNRVRFAIYMTTKNV